MTPYSAAILCGGRSLRMKQDKALMNWNGKPLALYIAGGFLSCDDVFLSVSKREQFDLKGIPMVEDPVPGCGPLAGLIASLNAAKHDVLFVTTCDAPLVDERTADILTSMLKDHDAVVPRTKDRIHPLIAVYKKSILPSAVRLFDKKKLKMRDLLESLDIYYADAGILPYGEDTLSNLNTPEELKKFQERFSS